MDGDALRSGADKAGFHLKFLPIETKITRSRPVHDREGEFFQNPFDGHPILISVSDIVWYRSISSGINYTVLSAQCDVSEFEKVAAEPLK